MAARQARWRQVGCRSSRRAEREEKDNEFAFWSVRVIVIAKKFLALFRQIQKISNDNYLSKFLSTENENKKLFISR